MFVTVLSIALVALMPGGPMPSSAPALPGGGPSSAHALLGGGGPDTYGYKYLDSDTTCPGAPTFNWVSIKGRGTEITALTDDTCVGPFPIGFQFPYYWYRVDSVAVGSNGYITFGDLTKSMQTFKSVPNTAKPNDQLAAMLTDLQPEDSVSPHGSVWYWSNHTDSFIVEYDSIAFWSTGGNNTFQIILTKADSSITFQYKEQSGTPSSGWVTENAQVGIENSSGAIGLNYLSGQTPAGNIIHPDLAVRFFPPESALLHDVSVRNAMNDRNGGLFAVKDRPLSFWAIVKNTGNQAEAGYQTYFKVTRLNNSVVFADSVAATASNPGDVESLALASTWRPSTNGTYIIRVFTKLAGDMVPVNDTATLELHVVTIPGQLTYDSGTPVHTWYFYFAGNGWGNRFVPPVYPCSVQSFRIFMSMITAPSNPFFAIFDDNGPGGGPGDTLFDTTVTVSAPNPGDWSTVTLPSPVVINDGAFFVGAISVVDSEGAFGMDSVPPLSNQRWECTGGNWAPSFDPLQGDFMANATISGPVGIFESMEPAPVLAPERIDVNPNPFGSKTTIRLLNPTGFEKALEIYDATGSIVRRLELSRGQVVLDGRLLADGIYFARVTGTEAPVAKVIVTH
jgi:hypothetical protein